MTRISRGEDMAGPAADVMVTETLVEDARWRSLGLSALAERCAVAVLRHLGTDPAAFTIGVLGCGDARIAALNADFRGKPVPTNVLSWPSRERGAPDDGGAPPRPDPTRDGELGDIAISYDTCLNEARAAGLSLRDHVAHLLVHGMLHLLGYDHIRDKDATLMEATEVAILGKLGVDDPY